MASFKDLKKNRLAAAEKLSEKLEKMNKTFKNEDDDKFWRVSKDVNGNGFAIIRFFFLPDETLNEVPYVLRYEHSFKTPSGAWYIENCRSTLGKDVPDPVVEYNSKLWATKDQEKIELARKQKRKKYYFANILVVKDPAKPENEGKVFMFKFGQKIMDKIIDIQKPEYEGDDKIDPFDLWEGVNFRLSVSEVAGYPNYDKSKFDGKQTPIADNEEDIQKIWEQRHDLSKLIAPEAFKSYDELKARFEKVTGAVSADKRFNFEDGEDDDNQSEDLGSEKSSSKQNKFNFEEAEEKNEFVKPSKSEFSSDDDDDELDFFNSLAK